MNRSGRSVMFSVLLVLAVFAATPLAADPVVNTFNVSTKVPALTVGNRYPFTFRLFDSASGVIPLFEEVRKYTVPGSRTISHQLGSVNLVQPLLAEDFLQQLWVEVSVPAMAPFPRIVLNPVPLAIGSQNADMLDNLHAVDFALVGHTHGSGPGLDADTLDGQHGAFYLDAGNLVGVLSDTRLSGNVALLEATQTVLGTMTFSPKATAPFAVGKQNNAVVTNLNADLLDDQHGSDYRNAANLDSGALSTDRYSAYGDLVAEGYLGDAGGDIARNNGVFQPTLYAQRAQSSDALSAAALSALDVRYRAAPPLQSLGGYAVATADNSGAGGADSSIGVTIGADGLPVIAYVDFPARQIKVFHCGDATCSTGLASVVVDPTGTIAFAPDLAITIGSDGLPLIVYLEALTGGLVVVHCGNASCSSGTTAFTRDSSSWVGLTPSVTIGTDGLPVVSYMDLTNGDLKVLHCDTVDCSSGTTLAVDSVGNVGGASSIAIGANGLPVISYWDSTNLNLKVYFCGNAACNSGNAAVTIDSSGTVGSFTSLVVGADGQPVIAYYDQINDDLKVLHCGNAGCSAGNTITTADSSGDVGWFPSITIGIGGFPVVSYFDMTNFDLKVLHCGDLACSAGNTVATVDSSGSVGWNTSITSDAEGLPLIAYWDYFNGDLKVARRFIRTLGRR